MLAWFSVKVTTCSFQHGLRTSHVFTAVYNVRSRHTPVRVNFSFLFRLYGQVKRWDIFQDGKFSFSLVVTSTSGRNHSRSGRNSLYPYQQYACEKSCQKDVWKCVIFTYVSHVFNHFSHVHMYFTTIFHRCVKFCKVKHAWKGCEVMSTLSHKFSPAFHMQFYMSIALICSKISHATSHKISPEFHMQILSEWL